jgi:1-deoxy-D-xylulose-5-phosphate reductoisomerase
MAYVSSQAELDAAPRRVTILGSTGSVGCNTLELLERQPKAFRVEALTAHSSVALLAEQARRVRPRLAVIAEDGLYGELKAALAGSGVMAAAGEAALIEAAERPADWVMSAIVGAAGLEPTLAAVRRGAVVGLANKETLVCAGALIMAEIERCGATLLPVDSEHNAIFQVLDFERRETVERIILTASGGPFRTLGLDQMEAHYLFGLPEERIEILVHPQSVVHSLVAYIDGSVLAQLGDPDMRTPIAYALAWPNRMAVPVRRLELSEIGHLTFEAPDPARFPALRLARAALSAGGGAPTVLNAANEEAVRAFLERRIGFLEIAGVVEAALERLPAGPLASLDDVRHLDREAREIACGLLPARV